MAQGAQGEQRYLQGLVFREIYSFPTKYVNSCAFLGNLRAIPYSVADPVVESSNRVGDLESDRMAERRGIFRENQVLFTSRNFIIYIIVSELVC